MEAALDKVEKARARQEAAGAVDPDLEHLHATLAGLTGAQNELFETVKVESLHKWLVTWGRRPEPNQPGSVQLFKGLFEFVKAAATGFSSVAFVALPPVLLHHIHNPMHPFMFVETDGIQKAVRFTEVEALGYAAKRGLLGSITALQATACSICQVEGVAAEGAAYLALHRINVVEKAVWPDTETTRSTLRQRLERRHWVPHFSPAKQQGSPTAPASSPLATALEEDLRRCGAPGADLAQLRRLILVHSLLAGDRWARSTVLPWPQLQLLLCDAQEIFAGCTSAATTTFYTNTIAGTVGQAMVARKRQGFDHQQWQAIMALAEETMKRVEGQLCESYMSCMPP